MMFEEIRVTAATALQDSMPGVEAGDEIAAGLRLRGGTEKARASRRDRGEGLSLIHI